MRTGSTKSAQLLAALLAAGTVDVQADQLVIARSNYSDARIMSVEGGQLEFRASDGAIHREWISDIDFMVVEHGGTFDDFNQAERMLASGEADKAVVRYERALRLADEAWSDLVAARLLVACDRSGQFDKTAAMFVRVAQGKRTGAALAARMVPRETPAKRDAKFGRAMEDFDAALAAEPGDAPKAVLEALRFSWLRAIGDPRANRFSRVVPILTIPESVRTECLYRIVLQAMTLWLEKEASPTAMKALDANIRDCPPSILPEFLMLKGDTLSRSAQSREDLIRASWPYLRVAIHMSDDARAPDGLFAAAGLMQRIGKPNLALSLTEECLAHPRISEATKTRATAFRGDLQRQSVTP